MRPTPIELAEAMFKVHKKIDGNVVYSEIDVINILLMCGMKPDFDGYAQISKSPGANDRRHKKKLKEIGSQIQKGMNDKGLDAKDFARIAKKSLPEIYRYMNGNNLTLETVFHIESILGIKLTTV